MGRRAFLAIGVRAVENLLLEAGCEPPDLRADIAKPNKISYTLKAAEDPPAAGTRRAHGRAKLASPDLACDHSE
jgi:hypothetical protein